MVELLLVRHGATDWNAQSRFQGRSDIALNPLGIRQAEALARRLSPEPLARVTTSDLARVRQTADIIARERELEIEDQPLLREIDFGEWEGLTYAEIINQYPQAASAWQGGLDSFDPPGGESLSQMVMRVAAFLEQISKSGPDSNILVVSHGGPLQVLLCLALELPGEEFWRFRLETASLSRLSLTPQGAMVKLLNDTCHLSEAEEGSWER